MFKKTANFVFAGIVISTFLSLAFYLGLFASWQEKLSDNLFLPKKPSEKIVIIAIDDKSISEIGRWPWDRLVHAKLLDRLNSSYSPPLKVGLDISFFEDSKDDIFLAEALDRSKNVILASEEIDGQVVLPIQKLSGYAKTGVTNVIHDKDGVVRKIRLDFPLGFVHFASAVVDDTKNPKPTFLDPVMRINYIGKPNTFTTYSYIDVLEGKVLNNAFADKIVLIGATAQDLHDNQIVPTSNRTPMAGVEIQANAIQTILESRYLKLEDNQKTILTIFGFALFFSLVFSLVRIRTGFVLSLVLLIGYFIYVAYSFDQGIIRSLIYPPLAIVISFILSIVLKYTSESKQKRFLRKAFSHYVSEDVVKEIVNNPKKLALGGEKRLVTVLFTDIQGFTTISESLDPEKLTTMLNEYLTQMTEIVLKHKGVVDKFIGDSVMCFWNAPIENPDHALNACKAALEMKAVKVGEFYTRIGINTGVAVVGNMGSEERFDYTALGDTVNIASRLEGQNKNYLTQILISESTYKLVKEKVNAKLVDKVIVKGKTKSVKVYELISYLRSF